MRTRTRTMSECVPCCVPAEAEACYDPLGDDALVVGE